MRESASKQDRAGKGPGMSQESVKPSPTATPSGRAASLRNLRPPWQPGVSGNPLGRFKHVYELFDAMIADLGDLTGIEHALLWQAAKLMAKSERAAEANDAVRLANASARLLASVRTTRRKPGRPSLLRDRVATAEVEHAE
jgi:hypothetical protein